MNLTRRERIEALLDHWPDFFETAARDSGPEGGGVWLLPGMSRHPSVVELGRALAALQQFAPSKFVHLRAYYASPYRTTRQPKPVKTKQGRKTIKGDPSDPSTKTWTHSRERVVPAWVRQQKVRDAVSFVSQRVTREQELARPWCFRGEPFLPAPLLESPAGSRSSGGRANVLGGLKGLVRPKAPVSLAEAPEEAA